MADSSQQTFLTLDEQGRVFADLSGHLSATGVDLLAVEGPDIPLEDRQLRWLREGTGEVVADVYGQVSDGGPVSSRVARVRAVHGGADRAWAVLQAGDDRVPTYRDAHVLCDSTNDEQRVVAVAGNVASDEVATIIDSDGNSDFAFADLRNAVPPRGRVRLSAIQNVASGGSGSQLAFDDVVYLGGGMALSNGKLIAPDAGLYSIKAKLYAFSASGAAKNYLYTDINGASRDLISHPDPAPDGRFWTVAALELELDAGDEISARYQHDKGSLVSLPGASGSAGDRGNWLSARKVAS